MARRRAKKRQHAPRACEECGEIFRPRRRSQRFDRPECRYRHHNQARGRVTGPAAREWVEQHLLTVREAGEMSGASGPLLRGRVARGRMRALRIKGRVLLYRADVERMRGQ